MTKGQTLAVIEHAELALQVRQAEAAHRAAQTALGQAQKLAKIRVQSQINQASAQLRSTIVSLQQVEDLSQTRTTSQVEQAKAGLESLKANLEKIKRGREMKISGRQKPRWLEQRQALPMPGTTTSV